VIEATFLIQQPFGPSSPRALGEVDCVLSWRILQLIRAGYRDDEAVALACASEVDLHQALDLHAAGCPTTTALQILL